MKIKLVITGVVVCATLVAVSGCKKEEPAPGAPKAEQGTASDAATVVDAAKSAAKEVTDQAAAQVKAAEQQAQGLIDQAKTYVSEKKYQEALSSLSQLTNLKLTAEQQKMVDDLKAQIQSALAKATTADPAAALGGALKK
jgi:outer membrane PBP1 activator LpoA protein